jgi:hypothetical protein
MCKRLLPLLALFFILSCEDNEQTLPPSGVLFETGTFPGYQFIALSDKNGKVLLLKQLSSIAWLKDFGPDINVTLISRSSTSWTFTTYTNVVSDTLKPRTVFPSIGPVLGEHVLTLPDASMGNAYQPAFGLSCGMLFESPTRIKLLMCDETADLYVTAHPSDQSMPRYYYSKIAIGEETVLNAEDLPALPEMIASPVHNLGMSYTSFSLHGLLDNGNFVPLSSRIANHGEQQYFNVPGQEVMSIFPKIRSMVSTTSAIDPIISHTHIETADAPISHVELLSTELGEAIDKTYPTLSWTSTGDFLAYTAVLIGNSNGISFYWTVYGPAESATDVVLPVFDGDQQAELGLTTNIDANIYFVSHVKNSDFTNYRDWYTYQIEQPYDIKGQKVLSKSFHMQP